MQGSGQGGCSTYSVCEGHPSMHSYKAHILGRRVFSPMRFEALQVPVKHARV